MIIRTARLTLGGLVLFVACDGGSVTPPGNGGNGGNGATTGAIGGQVSADGAGVAGATIALAGGGTTTTGSTGTYTFASVPVGSRQLTLTVPQGLNLASGETATKTASVMGGQTATVNWQLTSGSTGGTLHTVNLTGISFSPSQISISVGDRVRWVAQDGEHTVTPNNASQAGVWTNQALSAGSSFEFTFTTAGTFNYHCQPHQAMGMTGTITVQ